MANIANQVIFITGASSGIGEALARELARRGAIVALAARRTERLETVAKEIEAAGGQAMALACDVTRDGDCEAAVAKIKERFGRLDAAVANAGFGVIGDVERLTLDDFRRQFDTNVFGVLRTFYATIGELKASRGQFVLVGSTSSYFVAPGMSAYTMSKFAVRALAESLHGELAASGVNVLLVNPGFITTEIRAVNNRGEVTDSKDPVPKWIQMPAADCARKIAGAMEARRRERHITAHSHAGIFLARHTPWLIRLATARRKSKTSKSGAAGGGTEKKSAAD